VDRAEIDEIKKGFYCPGSKKSCKCFGICVNSFLWSE